MSLPLREELATPQIISDMEPYLSPVDGSYVSGRAARRDDMAKHNCVEYEPQTRNREPQGQFRNKRFAQKMGLPLSEEARDR